MNITVRKDFLSGVVKAVLEQGADYGRSNAGAGEKFKLNSYLRIQQVIYIWVTHVELL